MNAPSSLSGRAFRVLYRRLPALLAASFWPYLLLVSVVAISATVYRHTHTVDTAFDPAAAWHAMSFLAKFRVLIGFVAGASIPYGLAFAGVSLLVYDDYRGQESSLGTVLKRVMGRLLPVAALSFLVGCGSLFGAFFFLIPGLIVAMLTPFAVPVLLLEETGIVTALRRSMHLAGSRIGTVLGLMLTLAIVWNLVVGIYFWWIRTLSLEGMAFAEAIWALLAVPLPMVMCVYCTTLTILYYDIRVSLGELQAPIWPPAHLE